jgi:hypothetical protein
MLEPYIPAVSDLRRAWLRREAFCRAVEVDWPSVGGRFVSRGAQQTFILEQREQNEKRWGLSGLFLTKASGVENDKAGQVFLFFRGRLVKRISCFRACQADSLLQ